jgi:hypothetical protein
MKDIIHSEKIIELTTHKTGITGASRRENSGLEQREDKQLPIESQGLLVDTGNDNGGNGDRSYLPSSSIRDKDELRLRNWKVHPTTHFDLELC